MGVRKKARALLECLDWLDVMTASSPPGTADGIQRADAAVQKSIAGLRAALDKPKVPDAG